MCVITAYVRAPCPRLSVEEKKRKSKEEARKRDPGPRRRAVPAERSRDPGVDPLAHRTPGPSDVRSALTCWIRRRECDAKVSRSANGFDPIRTSGRGEGAGRTDGRTDGCPPRFWSCRDTGPGGGRRGGKSTRSRFPVPRRGHLVTRFPLVPPLVHVVRFVIRFVGTTVTVTARPLRSSFPARPPRSPRVPPRLAS